MTRIVRFLRFFLCSAPEYRVRADLNALQERREKILAMFAERAGGNAKIIDGDFTVLNDLRKRGAL